MRSVQRRHSFIGASAAPCRDTAKYSLRSRMLTVSPAPASPFGHDIVEGVAGVVAPDLLAAGRRDVGTADRHVLVAFGRAPVAVDRVGVGEGGGGEQDAEGGGDER